MNRMPPRHPDTWKTLFPQEKIGEHLYQEFSARAQTAAAEIHRIRRPGETQELLAQLIESLGGKRKKVVMTDGNALSGFRIAGALHSLGVETFTTAGDIAVQAATADLGISTVLFGIAETGSVCQDIYHIESRLVSTLPTVHLVFLPARSIIAGIEDAFTLITERYSHGYLNLITGPNRTAAAESYLTLGFTGPERLIIAVADDPLLRDRSKAEPTFSSSDKRQPSRELT